LLAITYIFNLGTWNFSLNLNYEQINNWDINIVGLLLMVAAITKRAQIPFSAWLPAAIAAPTPVSSLVHSSTLVTAGVYLMIRFNFLLVTTNLGKYLFFIAIITTLMAGVGANYEIDLKKIIALSTLRQLGLIIRILSLGYPILAFFHLLTHAIFKALLFICAGNFIHRLKNNQDIRWIGGLRIHIPVTASCFLVANIALCGLPFLAGFYSKDLILERRIQNFLNYWGILIYFFSTGLTVSYTARVVKAALGEEFKGSPYTNWGDENWTITIPIILLTILAVLGGRLLRWLLIEPQTVIIPLNLKWGIYLAIIIGGFTGFIISYINFLTSWFNMYNISFFYRNIIFLPVISSYGIIKYPLLLGSNFSKNLDIGWRETFGPQGLYYYLSSARKNYESWQILSIKAIIFFIRIAFITLFI
jgi:NADH-ubiquinone oxidoreductase chain 5